MDKAYPVLPLLQFANPPGKQMINMGIGEPGCLWTADLRHMTTVREVAMTKSARRIAESPRIVAISPVWEIVSPVWEIATVSVNSDLLACFSGCMDVALKVVVDADVVLVEDVVVVLVVLVVVLVVVEGRSVSLLVILLVKITIEIPSSTGASALLR